jgi:hypothetical protein
MTDRGTLIRGNEAFDFIETIKDPVTRTLVNMALVKFIVEAYSKQQAPESNLDLLYVAKVLEGFFAEHEVIARTLRGEKVGAWFDDSEEANVGQPGSV